MFLEAWLGSSSLTPRWLALSLVASCIGFAESIKIIRMPQSLTGALQGWLGNKDTVLHSGEGVVSIARWAGKLVAWANDRGVKVLFLCLSV